MGGLFTAYFHHDGLGSIRDITDTSGNVLTSYDYDAFGEVKQGYIGKYNYNSFTGKQYDPESKLFYFGARWYDAKVGRFVTKDPMLEPVILQIFPIPLEDTSDPSSSDFIVPDMIDTPQDLHSYMYCYNNPINWIDPFGFGAEKPWYEEWWENYLEWQYEFWSDPWAVATGMFIPGVAKVGKFGKTAQEIISVSKKGSIRREFPSEMLEKTLAEIDFWQKKAIGKQGRL
jgi:RHS repeat-associated protein